MGKLRIRKLKPGETIFGGGKGILTPFNPTRETPTTLNSPSTSAKRPEKTPEQIADLMESVKAAGEEARQALGGSPSTGHGQEEPQP